jgi:hypothetical protein
MDTKVITSIDAFDDFVRFCDNNEDKPHHFPCAVLILEHQGLGHCEDWDTAIIVYAPDYTDECHKTYLAGVIKGWQTSK